MLPVGTKVFHNGHGIGEVIDHNDVEKDNGLAMA
jgi:hypothetical protein